MSDFWISVCLATPLVLVPLIWFLIRSYRTDKEEMKAFAARLKCPACGTLSLVWEGKNWDILGLCDDHEELVAGVYLRCNQCRKEFSFTREGELWDYPFLNEESQTS